MASCTHPADRLKADTASQPNPGTLTVRFCCLSCLVPITKVFMLTVPEPEKPAAGIDELLAAEDGAPAPKLRGANSPWRYGYKPSS
jgi:hypothetical protein